MCSSLPSKRDSIFPSVARRRMSSGDAWCTCAGRRKWLSFVPLKPTTLFSTAWLSCHGVQAIRLGKTCDSSCSTQKRRKKLINAMLCRKVLCNLCTCSPNARRDRHYVTSTASSETVAPLHVLASISWMRPSTLTGCRQTPSACI